MSCAGELPLCAPRGQGVRASCWEQPRSTGDTGWHCPCRAGLGSAALNPTEMAILAEVQKFTQLPQSSVMSDTEELKDIWLCKQREIQKTSPHKNFQPSLTFLA